MSTYLQLVQSFHRKAGMSGNAPTSVTNQTGEALLAVELIRDADLHIQKLWHNWDFLWSGTQYSAATVAGTQDATVPTTQGTWDEKTFRIDGELISVVEYEKVKHEIFNTGVADRNKPARIIILPNKNLRFDPIPDTAYTITADYYLKPVAMANNTDTSKIPSEYELVIIGQALIFHGLYEAAPDVQKHGIELLDMWLPRLESEFLSNEFNSRYTSSGNQWEVIGS